MENNSTRIVDVDIDATDLFPVPNHRGTPERNLLMAILERAILDYVGNDSKEVEAAGEWIFSDVNDPGYEQFTFSWVCQQLDLDLDFVANTIRDMPKRGNRRVAPWYFKKTG